MSEVITNHLDLWTSALLDVIANKGKAVVDVERNQDLLVLGLEKMRARHMPPIILDGHFTLLGTDGCIKAVEVAVFRALAIGGIVVYVDDAQAIAARMQQRDGDVSEPELIARHQEAELAHARLVATELGVPLKLLRAFDSAGLITSISDWSKTRRAN